MDSGACFLRRHKTLDFVYILFFIANYGPAMAHSAVENIGPTSNIEGMVVSVGYGNSTREMGSHFQKMKERRTALMRY